MSPALAFRKLIRAITGDGPAGPVTPSLDGFGSSSDAGRDAVGGRDLVVEPATRRKGRLLMALALPAIAFLGVLKLTETQADKVGAAPVMVETPAAPPVTDPAAPPVTDPAAPRAAGWRGYAIEATELEGLSPDASPGTLLEIWVTWEPPLTKGLKMQRLVREARLEKIVAPVVPEAPPTAVLSVRAGDLSDLLYGDRFGALSVAVLPGA